MPKLHGFALEGPEGMTVDFNGFVVDKVPTVHMNCGGGVYGWDYLPKVLHAGAINRGSASYGATIYLTGAQMLWLEQEVLPFLDLWEKSGADAFTINARTDPKESVLQTIAE